MVEVMVGQLGRLAKVPDKLGVAGADVEGLAGEVKDSCAAEYLGLQAAPVAAVADHPG